MINAKQVKEALYKIEYMQEYNDMPSMIMASGDMVKFKIEKDKILINIVNTVPNYPKVYQIYYTNKNLEEIIFMCGQLSAKIVWEYFYTYFKENDLTKLESYTIV